MHTVRNFNHKYMEKRGVDEQSHRDNSDTETYSQCLSQQEHKYGYRYKINC